MKAPYIGSVKTRMQPELTPEISLELYKAMGQDLVNHFSRCNDFDFIIQYTPGKAMEDMQDWLGQHLNYEAQRGANLGEKLHTAFSEAFDRHYQKVCIIGSDLPTLTKPDILGSFEKLKLYDLVLGPASDGGYYLIALKAAHPEIFQEVDWSTQFVLSQTLQKADQHQLSVFQLAMKEDIDTYNNLSSFWKYISDNKRELKNSIPNTMAVVKKIFSE